MATKPLEKDLLSELPDDIAVSILDKLDVRSSTMVGVLSRRWKHLPWLRSQLVIDIEKFKRKDMAAFAAATKRFLASSTVGDHVFQSLSLKFHLTDEERVTEILEVLGNAIHMNSVKGLELDMSAEMNDHEASESHAFFFTSLVGVSSSVFAWFKNLTIQHLRFAAPDLHNLLKSCKKLETLKMVTCDCGITETWVIDAPESQLRCLIFDDCDFGVISLLCLPKLEYLSCNDWFYSSNPLFLGHVPCLEQLHIKNKARHGQDAIVLSNFLANTPNIEQLSLGFGAERIWIQKECAQLLQGSFTKLKILSLTGIFLESNLLWILLLLESAPILEALNIQIRETQRDDKLNEIYGKRPMSISWEVSNFQHCHLKEVKFFGYQATASHLEFVRHVARRAICLEGITLVDDAFDSFLSAGIEERKRNFKSKNYKYKMDHNGQKRMIRLTYTKKLKHPKRSRYDSAKLCWQTKHKLGLISMPRCSKW